jgi:hypothetical protein
MGGGILRSFGEFRAKMRRQVQVPRREKEGQRKHTIADENEKKNKDTNIVLKKIVAEVFVVINSSKNDKRLSKPNG